LYDVAEAGAAVGAALLAAGRAGPCLPYGTSRKYRRRLGRCIDLRIHAVTLVAFVSAWLRFANSMRPSPSNPAGRYSVTTMKIAPSANSQYSGSAAVNQLFNPL